MTNVVIPLATYTNNNYLDLRFALRGISQYVPNADVTIIGAKPTWLRNITHIPANDTIETQWRERNIYRKLLLAPYESFLYMNDDHWILQTWQCDKYYYEKRLENRLYVLERGSIYRKTITNTLKLIPKSFNYDIHCPMMITKTALASMGKINWSQDYGYCMKSLAVYYMGVTNGTPTTDLKIRKPIVNLSDAIAGRLFFSGADGIMDKQMIAQMKIIYPEKSKWE